MNRLSRIQLSGFKSIREMDLELGALNVLIGPNGAGKSNLLSFFRMLSAIAEQRLQRFVAREGGAGAVLHDGRERVSEINARLGVDVDGRVLSYAVRLGAVGPDALSILAEEAGEGQATFRSEGPARETTAFQGESVRDLAVRGRRVYHFHDTSAEAPIRQGCPVADNRSLQPDGRNLAAFLHVLKQTRAAHYARIRDTIRMVAPFFDDFVLEPDVLNADMIHLEWRERGSVVRRFAHQLSDGLLRFIALATVVDRTDLPHAPTPSSSTNRSWD
jgi:predicted ATPase